MRWNVILCVVMVLAACGVRQETPDLPTPISAVVSTPEAPRPTPSDPNRLDFANREVFAREARASLDYGYLADAMKKVEQMIAYLPTAQDEKEWLRQEIDSEFALLLLCRRYRPDVLHRFTETDGTLYVQSEEIIELLSVGGAFPDGGLASSEHRFHVQAYFIAEAWPLAQQLALAHNQTQALRQIVEWGFSSAPELFDIRYAGNPPIGRYVAQAGVQRGFYVLARSADLLDQQLVRRILSNLPMDFRVFMVWDFSEDVSIQAEGLWELPDFHPALQPAAKKRAEAELDFLLREHSADPGFNALVEEPIFRRGGESLPFRQLVRRIGRKV